MKEENKVHEEESDLGLLDMLLDITKEDLTEEEVIESLKIELKNRWEHERKRNSIFRRWIKNSNY